MQSVLRQLRYSLGFREIRRSLEDNVSEILVSGLDSAGRSLFLAALIEARDLEAKRQKSLGEPGITVIVTPDPYSAAALADDLEFLVPGVPVEIFPALEVLPHEAVTQDPALMQQRLRSLELMLFGESGVVIVPAAAAARRLIPQHIMKRYCRRISLGQELDLPEFLRLLTILGYKREDLVEGPGQFSARGGIIDIFMLTADHPIRIELFDNEIDSIRKFDPDTQRSYQNLDSFILMPARDSIYLPELVPSVEERVKTQLARQAGNLRNLGLTEAAERLEGLMAEHLEKIKEQNLFPGIDQFMACFYQELDSIWGYLKSGLIIFDNPDRVKQSLNAEINELGEQYAHLLEEGRVLPAATKIFATWHDVYTEAQKHQLLYLSPLGNKLQGSKVKQTVNLLSRHVEQFNANLANLALRIKEWQQAQTSVVLVVAKEDRLKRLTSDLFDRGIEVSPLPESRLALPEGKAFIAKGSLSEGVELPEAKLVVLSEAEILGRKRRRLPRRLSVPEGARISSYGELRAGDYVVHITHGIGIYRGITTLEIDGVHRDYLEVYYANDDKLYVPTDQLNLLQKYVGAEGSVPRLSKLGGTDWSKAKKRVKESVRELAEGLLKLYSERQLVQGHAYSPDTPWQQEFEAAFPYEETEDQLRSIAEIKQDMEKPQPMDRLLCGDVGFGKTEVALRAAFKAVMDGKQVAFLVPTTILAQQHYETIKERFEGFPVKHAVLSRFQSAKEQKAILKALARGEIDILVGTHRILSPDVIFKDLGLVIIDEEQRFGVAQKERLKELRLNVDVLTMTATPIPRTLHMAMAGVRNMSLIETPPEGRYPVRTYVMPFDDEVIRQAILREIARDGQVFFVHNRVQDIDWMASYLHNLVPEIDIAIAHGQMDEDSLENVMYRFLNNESDLLLATTIIESGLDIPNANTLIVYDADKLGLAQLYQLRGRVGRSNRVAYAYFTYRPDKLISEESQRRLKAIQEFTELGSGFRIAMRDLEIRGAGNILGPEQHGHIAAVGFDLYVKLLEEAVRELKGEAEQAPPEPLVDLKIDAYIPDEYIPDVKQKVEIYKKIVAAPTREQQSDLLDELTDRYGEPPLAVLNMLTLIRIKALAAQLGVSSVQTIPDGVMIKFHSGLSLPMEKLVQLIQEHKGRIMPLNAKVPKIKIKQGRLTSAQLIALVEEVLTALALAK
ncbi:MAG: transcription-repair coupling factor [Firmicutes bacterium]|nr:transcription-repair coupling factor [Bacillota bacterium]